MNCSTHSSPRECKAPFTLSVIIPVYNEATTILEVLKRVVAVPIPKEIIVVDDQSTDGTVDLLRDFQHSPVSFLGESVPAPYTVQVIFHEQNQGKGAAIRTAIPTVTGDAVIIQDADLEYDPAEYSKLVAPFLNGRAEVVYGSRFYDLTDHTFSWHTWGNSLLTRFSNLVTNLDLTDMETGYKLFSADLLKRIPLQSNRFGFEPEVTVKIARLGVRICEVPVSYVGRSYAEGKKIGWKDGISALWCILRYSLFENTDDLSNEPRYRVA